MTHKEAIENIDKGINLLEKQQNYWGCNDNPEFEKIDKWAIEKLTEIKELLQSEIWHNYSCEKPSITQRRYLVGIYKGSEIIYEIEFYDKIVGFGVCENIVVAWRELPRYEEVSK